MKKPNHPLQASIQRQEREQELIDLLEPENQEDQRVLKIIHLMSQAKIAEEINKRLEVEIIRKPIDLSHLPDHRANTPRGRDNSIIHFGKHKGTKWDDLSIDYLVWLQLNNEHYSRIARSTLVKRGFYKKLNSIIMTCHHRDQALTLLTKFQGILTMKQRKHLSNII